jgi:hypothetical protein
MKYALALLVIAGCAATKAQQAIESPTATTRPVRTEAPPASTSDVDRNGLVQSFNEMQWTQQSFREAEAESAGSAAAGRGSAAPPKKVGPAVEAPKP